MTKSNWPSRFEVFFNGNSYEFTTDLGVNYQIAFVDYSGVLEIHTPVYMLLIDRFVPECCSKKYDERIKYTILHILEIFFHKNNNAAIAIYDIIDGRQDARKRLFDYWYAEYAKGKVVKLEGQCVIDERITHAALFYSINSSNKIEIVRGFNNILDNNFYC